jgi:hypothetical protein
LPSNATRPAPASMPSSTRATAFSPRSRKTPGRSCSCPAAGSTPARARRYALAREVMEETGYASTAYGASACSTASPTCRNTTCTRRNSAISTPPASVPAGRSPRRTATAPSSCHGRWRERLAVSGDRHFVAHWMKSASLATVGRRIPPEGRTRRRGNPTPRTSARDPPPCVRSSPRPAPCRVCGKGDQPVLFEEPAVQQRAFRQPVRIQQELVARSQANSNVS